MRYLTRGIEPAAYEAIEDEAHEALFMRHVNVIRNNKHNADPDTKGMQWVGRNKLFRDPDTFGNYGRPK